MNKIQNAVATKEQTKKNTTLAEYMQMPSMMEKFKMALPKVMTVDRFVRIAVTSLQTTPNLDKCTPASFFGAMIQSAQAGLEPNSFNQQAFVLPYYNSKKGSYEAQFQIGYKGLLALCYRSGLIDTIYSEVIYSNDEYKIELGLHPTLEHKPNYEDRGTPILVYAVGKTKDGGNFFEVMSVKEIVKHAQTFSQSYKSSFSPWNSSEESRLEMYKKTVLKRMLKRMPMSTEVFKAVSNDESIKTEISDDMSMVENVFDVTDFEVKEEPVVTEEVTNDEA